MKITNDEWHMKLALEEAEKAFKEGEVPVGCIIVDGDGNIKARTHNLKETNNCTTDHAEILAIAKASEELGDWRLNDYTVYVTLEPCPMCLYALLQARVKRVVFGAYDSKAGSISLGYNYHLDSRFNHSFAVVGGYKHFECSKLISNFFKLRRKSYQKS